MKNEFPGQCRVCRRVVRALEGERVRVRGHWRVQHAVCGAPPPDIVVVAGNSFTIERHTGFGGVLYGCGILPLRRSRADLIRDIERAQGPDHRP